MNSEETIREILKDCKTIAVVGLSSNSMRASNAVSAFMLEKGYKVIPVNPNETEVLGARSFDKLSEVKEKVDLVDIFRRSEFAGVAVDEAIEIGAKAVWLQEGVIDQEASKRAEDAGLLVVMGKCWLKEFYKYAE